jgi:prophage DNA circulation protein
MASIIDLSDIAESIRQPRTQWRDELLPATFAGQQFHCEANSREGGQRAVTHEFPKRDLPYTETMGRRAMEFTIRGYCIAYPFDTTYPLYRRDYRKPRDNLINVLDSGQPGILQLPTQAPMWVVCSRYRMNEEERFGGYCVFDMSFIEYGKTQNPAPDVTAQLLAASQKLVQRTKDVLAQGPAVPPGS